MPYGTDQGFTDWLDSMGYTLPSAAPSAAVLRARGSAYLDGVYERLWTGYRTEGVMQELGWPRTGATVACTQPIPADAIPPAVVNASYRAGYLEAMNPGILTFGITPGRQIKSEKVDVIQVTYQDAGKGELGVGGTGYFDSEVDGAMRAFICNNDDAGKFFFGVLNGGC